MLIERTVEQDAELQEEVVIKDSIKLQGKLRLGKFFKTCNLRMFSFMEGKEDGWCLNCTWNKSAFTLSFWLKLLKIFLKYCNCA